MEEPPQQHVDDSGDSHDPRKGTKLLLIGAGFTAAGVILLISSDLLLAIMTLALGVMGLVVGFAMIIGMSSPLGRWSLIVGGAAFTITCTAMALAAYLHPDQAWRPAQGPPWLVAIIGIIGALLFGTATITLITKEFRRLANRR